MTADDHGGAGADFMRARAAAGAGAPAASPNGAEEGPPARAR